MIEHMDLVREILLRLNGRDSRLAVEGYEEAAVHLTADRLRQEGYIRANTAWSVGRSFPRVMPEGLTAQGKQLLGAIRRPNTWRMVKYLMPDRPASLAVLAEVADHVQVRMN